MSNSGVENVPSGAKWTTGFPKGILDVPSFKGCCGGFFKFSYVVSAPLHMKGFFEFWRVAAPLQTLDVSLLQPLV
tara:strand:+ start:2896 stop:3120 length:225 start_codon:yes stop_codon:yes gene_type:complete